MRGDKWLCLMLSKRQRFTKGCQHLTGSFQQSSSTSGHYSKPACSNQKPANFLAALRKSYRPKSTKSFSKTSTSLSLTTGASTAKSGKGGRNICAGRNRKNALTAQCVNPKSGRERI